MSRTPERPHDDPPWEPLQIPEEPAEEPLSFAAMFQRVRGFFWQTLALLGACVMLLVAVTGTAGWYTSRSQFCNSCHIMEPYYVSWQQSSHKDVSCIKCHFPPGVGEKMRGKVLGLVQVGQVCNPDPGTASDGGDSGRQLPAVRMPRNAVAVRPRGLQRDRV